MREPPERSGQLVEVAGKLHPHQDTANPGTLPEPAIIVLRADGG
jgi:hypothetical protein